MRQAGFPREVRFDERDRRRLLGGIAIRAITVPIRGADHQNQRGPSRRFGIELCAPGDPVELRSEPHNKYDGNAIAIFERGGIQLGYVPAEKCQWLNSTMARGVELVAIFQGVSEHGGFIRIGFDHTPTLPAPPPVRDRFDEDFPPDPIWDDD